MKIYKEIDVMDFEAWAGASDTIDTLIALAEKDSSYTNWECLIEECFADEFVDETDVNDFLWFETDYIAELLGFDDWETLDDFVRN